MTKMKNGNADMEETITSLSEMVKNLTAEREEAKVNYATLERKKEALSDNI